MPPYTCRSARHLAERSTLSRATLHLDLFIFEKLCCDSYTCKLNLLIAYPLRRCRRVAPVVVHCWVIVCSCAVHILRLIRMEFLSRQKGDKISSEDFETMQ